MLEEGKKLNVLDSTKLERPIYSTPVAANGVLYVSTMNRLYAIEKE
ncbi:MAG: PQQ-binding-like beta-propeller repeat protein [Bacteroidales bacterium]|nr:PQQ-binding-like beta-propeller repeat protein [Bacteroidales bacterium]